MKVVNLKYMGSIEISGSSSFSFPFVCFPYATFVSWFYRFLGAEGRDKSLGLLYYCRLFCLCNFVFLLEMQSNRSDSSRPITRRVYSLTAANDARGKHRIQAELKRLEQEARSLENELEQLEKMESASAACKELLNNVDAIPDPLLPGTNGATNRSWDPWSEAHQESQGCRCWIL